MGEVIADPKSEPVMTVPLEKALSDLGTHRRMALAAPGYVGASQAPSRAFNTKKDPITPAGEEKTRPGNKQSTVRGWPNRFRQLQV
jgi:hypothetical protein